jgi:quinoprotein glucose dehydrogenase
MWGATIFDQLACRIMFHRLRYEGTFTPPSLAGHAGLSGQSRHVRMGRHRGRSGRQIAIANPMNIPFVSKLIPRGPTIPTAPNDAHPSAARSACSRCTARRMASCCTLPLADRPALLRPPWGYMAGIDLKTMKIVWMHRNGTIRDSSPLPIPIKMGVPSLGGPMTTAGGVAFLTSTQDYYIRAYDVATANSCGQDRLPAGGQSTPMSYAVDGQQYVVTAAGGHGSFGTKPATTSSRTIHSPSPLTCSATSRPNGVSVYSTWGGITGNDLR